MATASVPRDTTHNSLIPQRSHRIDSGGAVGWDEAGEHRDGGQHDRGGSENADIVPGHLVELILRERPDPDRRSQANESSD